MVHNLEKTLDNIEKRGIERGIEKRIEKGKVEVARNLIKMGMDLLMVIKATGLTEEEVNKVKQDMN
ncbi:hypothetical protein GOM49_04480 [Clostridium bovifaecis]|uniref:Transposase n=1 Tax=Clostridium bovifaecis TaxID=2184719 RepID=A0A6I6EUC5_9CLOT|nr:hypothetical protein GOM49_04480 [Clostridium bovifaecis]